MIGDIDSTIPNGITHLIDRGSDVCHQHGGVVTSIQFDSLEEMSLDKFLKDVVPTLRDKKDSLTIIKDPVRQNMYRILNDNVAIYHITGMQDAFLDTFMESLVSERPLSIQPNLTYPLIKYATTKEAEKLICVSIPEKQFTYHVSHDAMNPFVIWHPPLWLYLKLNQANIPTGVKIGVVLEREDDVNSTSVYHLPFPNCYPDGRICFGGTQFSNPNPGRALKEATAIEMTYQRLFNSEFNTDLVNDSEIRAFEAVCAGLPDYQDIQREIENLRGIVRYCTRIKYAFRDKASVWKYKYHRMSDGRNFLEYT